MHADFMGGPGVLELHALLNALWEQLQLLLLMVLQPAHLVFAAVWCFKVAHAVHAAVVPLACKETAVAAAAATEHHKVDHSDGLLSDCNLLNACWGCIAFVSQLGSSSPAPLIAIGA
jgi:hypothetical protein